MRKDSIEITVLTTTDGADIVADTLTEITGEGVCVSDEKDVLEILSSKTNWDYVEGGLVTGESGVKVKGFCKASERDRVIGELKEKIEFFRSQDFGIDFGELEVSEREVSTENWNDEWRKFYKTIELEKIAVVPDWIEYAGDKEIVRLEPGMAFGTGEHASTRLCLGLLEKLDLLDKTVIDIGTGSGILGIATAKLGAKSVYMTDIDEKAVLVARENVEKNGVGDVCVVEAKDLADKIDQDIVIANLTADILLRLLERLASAVKSGAKLVVSGIIAERLDEVVENYEKAGFKVVECVQSEDWRALYMVY